MASNSDVRDVSLLGGGGEFTLGTQTGPHRPLRQVACLSSKWARPLDVTRVYTHPPCLRSGSASLIRHAHTHNGGSDSVTSDPASGRQHPCVVSCTVAVPQDMTSSKE